MSRPLYHRPPYEIAVEMFADLLARKVVAENGCWIRPRTGKRANHYLGVKARPYSLHAHRLANYVTTGVWAPVVRHECDNPPCFRPEHLKGGTQADNLADMTSKGRRMDARGRRWVSRGADIKQVRESELDVYVRDGWSLGRHDIKGKQFGTPFVKGAPKGTRAPLR